MGGRGGGLKQLWLVRTETFLLFSDQQGGMQGAFTGHSWVEGKKRVASAVKGQRVRIGFVAWL